MTCSIKSRVPNSCYSCVSFISGFVQPPSDAQNPQSDCLNTDDPFFSIQATPELHSLVIFVCDMQRSCSEILPYFCCNLHFLYIFCCKLYLKLYFKLQKPHYVGSQQHLEKHTAPKAASDLVKKQGQLHFRHFFLYLCKA